MPSIGRCASWEPSRAARRPIAPPGPIPRCPFVRARRQDRATPTPPPLTRRFAGRAHPVVISWSARARAQRAVAQFGSALDWGSSGRRFKSCQPDRHGGQRTVLEPSERCEWSPRLVHLGHCSSGLPWPCRQSRCEGTGLSRVPPRLYQHNLASCRPHLWCARAPIRWWSSVLSVHCVRR